MDLTLYNFPLSPCGEKVRLALAEKGATYREISIDLGRKENLTPEFLRMSPKGYVPVLVAGADVVRESTVIIEYLDDLLPDPPLRPPSPAERSRMRLWTKLVDETLHPAWPGLAWPILVRPRWLAQGDAAVERMLNQLPDPARRERQRRLYRLGTEAPDSADTMRVFDAVIDDMEEALAAGPWLAGSAFSLADIAVLPYLFVVDVFGMRDRFESRAPRVADWYARADARLAWGGSLRSLYPAALLAEVGRLSVEARLRIASGAAPDAGAGQVPRPESAAGRAH
ncbi:MAG: glutathione S-transferase family protein [Alphaproteobacteria bacterium]|nr:glutathione S-transferase family protein [Alphaproteobacteria bacterium]